MLRTRSFLLFSLISIIVTSAISQSANRLAAVPRDPLELATGPVEVADTADARASILSLLERARQNNNLHAPGGQPFDLKVSFHAAGQTSFTGAGDMEEVWAAPSTWRWTAHLGDYSQDRIYYKGFAYDANPHAYLPLRLQTVRHSIFWPVAGEFAGGLIRVAQATWNGAPVTCALLSGPRSEASATPGRRWEEEEFCVDPKSGLLQTYSVAPGIYAVYDYNGALQFHGRTLARRISIVEDGSTALQLQLDSLQDAGSVPASMFTPTPEMQAPGVIIQGAVRFSQIAPIDAAKASQTVQPVIVHAALDATGKVLEAEALQTSDASLSDAALQLVKNSNYGPSRRQSAVPLQREVFISVRFRPAQ